ncbi:MULTISPECIES: hypothetical protein [unclassified Mesorhizobium]|uniref:hypothetical protein n=1 Tax=unclassified Mesorhizobium TaxID=325217 RepID=UPI001CCDBF90|nr:MULTISPECIES: hypothetical protein [unclassified Mesorhizobium]MBZ9683631.1 hypothetical protein [Mesorhizobium sp. CO1-1-2]MBZ9696511.1 hypothetical protein [Mesorhizobium sp. CO1-1-9]MBZ9923568.1 hypothetical protein [Mesorhizobium sp. BR1-1-4]
MAFKIVHNVDKAVRQLLGAPKDLYGEIRDQGQEKPLADATEAHRRLYAQYVADFATAYEVGDAWWQDCVEAFVLDGYKKAEAVDLAYDKRLAGPASAPEVVWFFRTYWLSFDELNGDLPPADRVPPQTAMLAWLVEDGRKDYVRLLTCMPYWPIGLDENGNWS